MKTPPIDWEDLITLGMDASATVSGGTGRYTVEPPPPKLVRQLMAALANSPAPEDNRVAYLRHVRDLLIGLTDWTQAADAPLAEEQRAAWATYRRALRDLPAAYSGDGPIPWPKVPA